MGLLRFLLAIAVILSHSGSLFGLKFVSGPTAVEAFFIISGFYIALILNEKYVKANDSYRLFITNRFLRLYPMYWVMLIISLICSYCISNYDATAYGSSLTYWETHAPALNFSSFFTLAFTNIFLFGQDVIMFMAINIKNGTLFFVPNFRLSNTSAYSFLFFPQTWSIGLELTFYCIAPFMVRRKYPVLIIIIVIAAFAKLYAVTHHLNYDPWTYRFFPFELMYFLLGALAYVIYKRFIQPNKIPGYVNYSFLIGMILLTVTNGFLHSRYAGSIYCFCVFCSTPILFKYTKNLKTDRLLGELSYPIYITHMFVLNLVKAAGVTNYHNVITISGSVVLSIILIKLVGNPIEKIRQSRVKKQQGINNVPDALLVKFNK